MQAGDSLTGRVFQGLSVCCGCKIKWATSSQVACFIQLISILSMVTTNQGNALWLLERHNHTLFYGIPVIVEQSGPEV